MFVFDVDPGRYCTKDLPITKGGAASTPPAATDPPDPRLNPQTARLEGVREVHATWSFGHNTCNFVQRLYIQYASSIIHIKNNLTQFSQPFYKLGLTVQSS